MSELSGDLFGRHAVAVMVGSDILNADTGPCYVRSLHAAAVFAEFDIRRVAGSNRTTGIFAPGMQGLRGDFTECDVARTHCVRYTLGCRVSPHRGTPHEIPPQKFGCLPGDRGSLSGAGRVSGSQVRSSASPLCCSTPSGEHQCVLVPSLPSVRHVQPVRLVAWWLPQVLRRLPLAVLHRNAVPNRGPPRARDRLVVPDRQTELAEWTSEC